MFADAAFCPEELHRKSTENRTHNKLLCAARGRSRGSAESIFHSNMLFRGASHSARRQRTRRGRFEWQSTGSGEGKR